MTRFSTPAPVRRSLIAVLAALAVFAGLLRAAPARAEDPPITADRSAVLLAWQDGGAQVRRAAEAALTGGDDQIRAFLDGGAARAQRQDERDAVLAAIGDSGPAVRAAARTALDTADDDVLAAFLDHGWRSASEIDARVRVNQLMAVGGDQVKQAGQQALDSESPAKLRQFLDTGWQAQWQTDQRLRVNQAMQTGGPEVRTAGQRALDAGTAEALESFLEYGWAVAASWDEETATLTGLLAQAEAAGTLAAQETQRATEEAEKARAAAEAARKAAAEAAAATDAARNDTAEAAAQAKRAADAAQKAAASAKVAVQAAAAANRAARAAATAAQRAASAASRAEQAATSAYRAAADAATDATKAATARQAAQTARDMAKKAREFADTADQAGKAIQAGHSAVAAAKSAAQHAKEAAAANDQAVQYAKNAGADAREAIAAAARARANAERAVRAANAAEGYLQVAIDAAFASRDAARRAADHAEAAAVAAIEAAEHAGEAAEAANRATAAAQAATTAATAAVGTAAQAQMVFDAARVADAERLAVVRDEALEDARAASAEYDAQRRAADWDAGQYAQRTAETNRLLALAQNPATDPAIAVTSARRAALAIASGPGAWSRQAALGALTGTDAEVLQYARTVVATAAAQDDRAAVMDIGISDNPKLAAAAKAALAGSDAQVSQFLQSQSYPGRYTDDRLKVNQIRAAAVRDNDVVLAQAAQAALDEETLAALRGFLDDGQYTAAATGQRVRVNQIISDPGSGPELRAAAQVALDGPPPALAEFLDTGRYTAIERDATAAAHIVQVAGMVQRIHQIAETAVGDALQAQSMAARARGDAVAAVNYANQAAQSAEQAAQYANQANTYANQAAASVQKAADAVATARAAATRAVSSARSAVRSASWAVASYESAVASAEKAQTSAKAAYDSAVAAGKDADLAAAAANDAYNTYLFERNSELLACHAEYAEGPAPELEKLLTGQSGKWWKNCAANVIGDPAELANRAYKNAGFCGIYPENSRLYQNCLHSVLDPAFSGMQPLLFFAEAVKGMMAMLAPVAVTVVAGCIATVVCGIVAGTLLTLGDVGLNVFKHIKGDQSLADTLLHIGRVALESLIFVGVGKLVSAGFRALKGLYLAGKAAKAAEAELQLANLSRLKIVGLPPCLRAMAKAAAAPNCTSLVPYNLDELSRRAFAARGEAGFPAGSIEFPGGNVAVARVEGYDGLIVGFSRGNGFHSEDDILAQIEELKKTNPGLGKITALYSERQPCPVCAGKLPAYLAPDAKITWSVPWGDNPIINDSANKLLAYFIAKASRATS
ncbi:hypothetical protein [Paractinoplanes brasiliensis]|uniref:Short repeat uncharacterized protein predicted to be involved in signal transduction n=1 Tax=Paractinoplanes brasiliensis TaxID=52695 RepID=A0A4R6JYP0_9ACTN|nr:hypothetical protein [Actinoplanes brasiliensis]TDO41993.1 short repeat uncharacterized protein predicted to be involved in signal transduction [Actinoplanes brasiliensis]GID29726.1 hypothetical protein Abr02nite_47090 [Actinoplanes brasiliensis]